jgi:hypothetical protein
LREGRVPGDRRADGKGREHVAEIEADLKGWVPMDAVALPDDVARVALFLRSDESRWVERQKNFLPSPLTECQGRVAF